MVVVEPFLHPMVNDANTQSERVDLTNLSKQRDPDGRKTYMSVYVDLTRDDWDMALKQKAEAVRRQIGPGEGEASLFHEAFDQAFIGVEKVANTGATSAAVFVSPPNDFEELHALDRKVEIDIVLDMQPFVTPLTG